MINPACSTEKEATTRRGRAQATLTPAAAVHELIQARDSL